MNLIIILYITLGLLPSLIWLSFYLREDTHSEPKKMILKVFLWGSFITIPVFFVQIGLEYLLESVNLNPEITSIIYWFLIISFSEELFKYLVIRVKVFNSYDLDEPLDVMLYMVIAALGFAAVENILYLFSPAGQMSLDETVNRALGIAIIRFVGATFLHTLCSAIIGYSIAISFDKPKRKYATIILGILIAVFLHGLYNFSLMTTEGFIQVIIPIAIIFTLAILVLLGFSKLKKMKGECEIN